MGIEYLERVSLLVSVPAWSGRPAGVSSGPQVPSACAPDRTTCNGHFFHEKSARNEPEGAEEPPRKRRWERTSNGRLGLKPHKKSTDPQRASVAVGSVRATNGPETSSPAAMRSRNERMCPKISAIVAQARAKNDTRWRQRCSPPQARRTAAQPHSSAASRQQSRPQKLRKEEK